MLIPPHLREEIVSKSRSHTQDEIAAWLKSDHGVTVTRQAIQKLLAAERARTREATQSTFDAFGEVEAPRCLDDLKAAYVRLRDEEQACHERFRRDPTTKTFRIWQGVHAMLAHDRGVILKISGGLESQATNTLSDFLHEIARKRSRAD